MSPRAHAPRSPTTSSAPSRRRRSSASASSPRSRTRRASCSRASGRAAARASWRTRSPTSRRARPKERDRTSSTAGAARRDDARCCRRSTQRNRVLRRTKLGSRARSARRADAVGASRSAGRGAARARHPRYSANARRAATAGSDERCLQLRRGELRLELLDLGGGAPTKRWSQPAEERVVEDDGAARSERRKLLSVHSHRASSHLRNFDVGSARQRGADGDARRPRRRDGRQRARMMCLEAMPQR